MLAAKVKYRKARPLTPKIRNAAVRVLNRSAAAIRLTARRSIRRSKKPSPRGKPPHTRHGRLRESIKYYVDPLKQRAIVGPAGDVVGPAGKAHEFGGVFRDEKFDRRPFMRPALERMAKKLPALWLNSIR